MDKSTHHSFVQGFEADTPPAAPSEPHPAIPYYQRRGSAPTDLPPRLVAERREQLLTRHTSLNGKGAASRRKKQLKRRSSGGPETVCLAPASEGGPESCARLALRRPENNADMLLARRRGSLPIEVLTVGRSGESCVVVSLF